MEVTLAKRVGYCRVTHRWQGYQADALTGADLMSWIQIPFLGDPTL